MYRTVKFVELFRIIMNVCGELINSPKYACERLDAMSAIASELNIHFVEFEFVSEFTFVSKNVVLHF